MLYEPPPLPITKAEIVLAFTEGFAFTFLFAGLLLLLSLAP